MSKYTLEEIPPDSYFSQNVSLDDEFLLTTPEIPFSNELKKTLQDWRFKAVFSNGEPQKTGESLQDNTQSIKYSFTNQNDGEKIKEAEKFYLAFQEYAEKVFTRLISQNKLEFNPVAETIKSACGVIQRNQRYILRVLQTAEPHAEKNYLTSHVVQSTIIALVIGSYLKLPSHRLIELGVAALFHEVGMLKLPSQVILSSQPLTLPEQKALQTHPILGYGFLKSFDFPLAISVVALEHHERENGSGYPRKLTGDRISLYSKIVAVACSWEALSAVRPYKEAKDGFSGMLELLKNEGKQYDNTVIRALICSLSIYPIGLYVLLSNGKKAQVVDVNPENPRFPIVQLLEEFTPGGQKKILVTSEDGDGVFIVSSLTPEEAGV
ncbi:phosphohydrolase [Spirochaetia bacterium]|nr:phosphohydrolase [Spirochaetia bacterium]